MIVNVTFIHQSVQRQIQSNKTTTGDRTATIEKKTIQQNKL